MKLFLFGPFQIPQLNNTIQLPQKHRIIGDNIDSPHDRKLHIRQVLSNNNFREFFLEPLPTHILHDLKTRLLQHPTDVLHTF